MFIYVCRYSWIRQIQREESSFFENLMDGLEVAIARGLTVHVLHGHRRCHVPRMARAWRYFSELSRRELANGVSHAYTHVYGRVYTGPIHIFHVARLSRATGHNYIGHDYIGHNYVGHNYVGHNYIDHNYIGHN